MATLAPPPSEERWAPHPVLPAAVRYIDFRSVSEAEEAQSAQQSPHEAAREGRRSQRQAAAKAAYRAYGNIEKAFYIKEDVFGLVGAAGTGKSRGLLEKCHLLAEKYPGSRGLFCRKTRASMTNALLVTFETKVLPPGHYLHDGNKRSHRQSYSYRNGSEIDVRGLDDPHKVMSTDYDWIYWQEASEGEESDLEMLSTRLRNGVMPYQQLMFDTNPSYPLHWINLAHLAGKILLLSTYHEDNPTLWQEAPRGSALSPEWPDRSPDGRVGRWTEAGARYMRKLLKLTGPRLQRLYYGKWAAAEGVVYDGWDADVHVVPQRPLPADWQRVWGIDFGHTSPFVWQCWAVDPDRRMWMEAEIYMSKRLVARHCIDIQRAIGWERPKVSDTEWGEWRKTRQDALPMPSAIVCDHSAEGRATFEQEMGLRTVAAFKSIDDGIQACAASLVVQADGLPRSMFMRGVLFEEDRELSEDGKPVCTVQEPDSYVWDESRGKGRKEAPIDEHNHGMDTWRYVRAHIDGLRDRLKGKDVAMAIGPEAYVAGVGGRGRTDASEGDGGAWTTFTKTEGRKSRRVRRPFWRR